MSYAVLERYREITPQFIREEAERISRMKPQDALELLALIALHHSQVLQNGEMSLIEVASQ